MTHLILQTAMLLLAAYVLGAICGSLLHRLLASEEVGTGEMQAASGAAMTASQPMIEVTVAPAPAIPGLSTANRFERALIGPRTRPRSDSTGAPLGTSESQLAGGASPVFNEAGPEIAPDAAAEPGSEGLHEIAHSEPAEVQSQEEFALPGPERSELDALSPPAVIEIVEPVREEAEHSSRVAEGDSTEAEPPSEVMDLSDEAEETIQAGPSARPADVLQGTIEQSRPMSLPAATGSGGVIGTSAPLAPSVQQSPDDLTRIRGIDADTASQLANLGVSSYARLAAFSAADVARIEASLGRNRISQENWIEQAQLLAHGRTTVFARHLAGEANAIPSAAETYAQGDNAAGAIDASEAAPMIEAEPLASQSALPDAAAEAALDSATAGPEVETAIEPSSEIPAQPPESVNQPAAEIISAPPEQVHLADKLADIRGIDAAAEALLHQHGVRRFAEIASWRRPEVSRFEGLIGLPGRINRENWIEQAEILASGGQTAFSRRRNSGPGIVARDAAPDHVASEHTARDDSSDHTDDHRQSAPAKTHLVGLRSVKSPLLAGHELSRADAAPDDLKRIRGIGLLIEKKLNSLGISRYSQIANWTAAEVARISHMLDFKGRIERESWIEQARILASGGQTEFSSRVDRE